jgi:tetratricopeptide (TPR) repeat protein
MLAIVCAVLLNAFWLVAPSQAAAQQQGSSISAASVAHAVEQARSPAVTEDDFARLVATGYALVVEGRFAEAAELFGALVEKRPRDASVLYGAALAVFNAGRPLEAEPLARRAVEAWLNAVSAAQANQVRAVKASAADAFVLLAVVQAVRGDDDAALKSAERAVALDPEHFDAQFTLGRALYGAGDDASASRAFRAAVALRPEDARARFFLATALERAGDDAGALAAYRELATRQPRAPEGHLGVGVLLVKRGGAEADEGVRELERALQINPNLYEARVTLGRFLVARGRAADAVAHLTRAAELAPNNPEPHYQLSLAYRRLGRKDEAVAESAIVKRIHESRRAPKD